MAKRAADFWEDWDYYERQHNAPLPDFLQDYTGPVGDEDISFTDLAFWVDCDDPELRIDADWIEALYRADYHGDKKPLVDLLRSGRTLQPGVLRYLADFLQRHSFRRFRQGSRNATKINLIDLMRTGRRLASHKRRLLIDLIANHDVGMPRGRARVPAYTLLNLFQARLMLAVEHIKGRRQPLTVRAAIAEAAQIYRINFALLKEYYENGHYPKQGANLRKSAEVKFRKVHKPRRRSGF